MQEGVIVKNKIKKIVLLSFVITVCVLFISGILLYIYGGPLDEQTNSIDISQVYHISGNILNTQSVYSNINLIIEEISEDNIINAVTLKDNKKISKIGLCNNVDISNLKDFRVIISDYDNNGTKDFSYVTAKNDNGYSYGVYSINKSGEISKVDNVEISANSNRASIKLKKTENGYEYMNMNFYYDGYVFPAQVGEYDFDKKSNEILTTISPESKVAISGEFNALPRKYVVIENVPENITNVNEYLTQATNKQFTEIDLDNDGRKEFIISFLFEGSDYVIMLDDLGNQLVTLVTGKNGESIKNNIEFADVDDDGVMEIIIVKADGIELRKYSNGFYF